ncbi:YecA family protein [Azospira restricta]|uniref:UPF0149 family protein n=1 Tax=Azospira restricta TaxID=404405 RepID=A0A974SMI2_9RHOO|nr:YecA family protein [Azospira restricta]QRJ62695.1 UPF0149 family protein [Azospira restricta]
MTETTLTKRQPAISDDQLDRLEGLLDDPAFDEAMRLDEAQGYLCAALAGPVPVPEGEWLLEILGSEAGVASEAGQEAAALLRCLAADIAIQLADDEPLMLYLYPQGDEDDAPSDYEPWCLAYLHGVDTAVEDWFEGLADEEEVEWLDERLFPLMVLTGEAEAAAREHGEAWPEGEELAELLRDSEEELARAVSEIFMFWAAKRGHGTIRRNNGKVGRNDPCPCGSGRKYKQCCGAAA